MAGNKLLILLIIAFFGGVSTLYGFSMLHAYARMALTDPTDVAAVREGMDEVELVGTARPIGNPLTAPISGTDTLAYDWKIQAGHKREGWSARLSGGRMARVESGESDPEPFVLDDGTGEIVVDPSGAATSFEAETWEVHDGEEPPGMIREFLERSDSDTDAASEVVHSYDRRFEERRLDPGEDVYVFGPVKAGPHEDTPRVAVDPYVGTEGFESEDVGDDPGWVITWDLLPGVGDPDRTLTMGGAGEGGVFTIADSGEKAAQRRFLKLGLLLSVLGILVLAVGVGWLFGFFEATTGDATVLAESAVSVGWLFGFFE